MLVNVIRKYRFQKKKSAEINHGQRSNRLNMIGHVIIVFSDFYIVTIVYLIQYVSLRDNLLKNHTGNFGRKLFVKRICWHYLLPGFRQSIIKWPDPTALPVAFLQIKSKLSSLSAE